MLYANISAFSLSTSLSPANFRQRSPRGIRSKPMAMPVSCTQLRIGHEATTIDTGLVRIRPINAALIQVMDFLMSSDARAG
jgi:hypothetical protein